MARSREKKHHSLVHQVEMKLKSKMAIGHSKYDDQRAERALLKEKRKKDSKATLSYQERITIHKIYTWRPFRIIRSMPVTLLNGVKSITDARCFPNAGSM